MAYFSNVATLRLTLPNVVFPNTVVIADISQSAVLCAAPSASSKPIASSTPNTCSFHQQHLLSGETNLTCLPASVSIINRIAASTSDQAKPRPCSASRRSACGSNRWASLSCTVRSFCQRFAATVACPPSQCCCQQPKALYSLGCRKIACLRWPTEDTSSSPFAGAVCSLGFGPCGAHWRSDTVNLQLQMSTQHFCVHRQMDRFHRMHQRRT